MERGTRASTPRHLIAVITATVKPASDMTETVVRDPDVRLREYEATLQAISSSRVYDRAVFVENSGFLASSEAPAWRAKFSKNIRFIDSSQADVRRGKGLGELSMLIDAVKSWPIDASYVKMTGRYLFRNMDQYGLRAALTDKEVLCDLRRGLTWADTRIFTFTINFLEQYVVPLTKELDDSKGLYLEHVVCRGIHAAFAEGRHIWAPNPLVPDLRGRSGSTGESISVSWPKRFARDRLRQAFNLLMDQ